jgi:hypothetical protein
MKSYLVILVGFVFASCSRDPNNITPTTSNIVHGELQYKVNGNLVTIKNTDTANLDHVAFTKQTRINAYTPTIYLLSGVKDSNNSVYFGIETDSLLVGNYNIKIPDASIKINGQRSELGDVGSDSLNVNITSYSKGLISGNFSGQLSVLPNPIPAGPLDWSSLPKTSITEGEFKNIKCIYH